LIVAANIGHEDCVRVLIAAKAGVDYVDNYGWTALHWAAFCNHASTCRVLINEGASLSAVDINDETPLTSAKARGNAECVAILEAAAAAAAATLGGAV